MTDQQPPQRARKGGRANPAVQAEPAGIGSSSAPDSLSREVRLLGSLLGTEAAPTAAPAPPLAPGLLAGGAVFLLSLLVAVGLYRRWPFFYWVSVAAVLTVPFVTIYQMPISIP